MTISHGDLRIDWLGYATVRIEGSDGTVVYLDPGRHDVLTDDWEPDTPGVGHPTPGDYRPRDGDLVLVTHDDHYDSDGIERVASEDATVVLYESVNPRFIDRDVARVRDLPFDVERVEEHDDRLFGDVIVRTVPAFNDPAGPHVDERGEPYHVEGNGVGYHVTIDDRRLLWPGDSDALEGHAELDVFLPPIGGAVTMDRHEAADLAEALDPDLAVPVHYNTHSMLETDAEAFALDVARRGVPVALDE